MWKQFSVGICRASSSVDRITDYNDYYNDTHLVFCCATRVRCRFSLTLVLLCFTELIVAWVAYVWGGAIKKWARPLLCSGLFILVISNINIGFLRVLNPPLNVSPVTTSDFDQMAVLFVHKQLVGVWVGPSKLSRGYYVYATNAM